MLRKREQKGHIVHKHGGWFLRYLDDVVDRDGITVKRKLMWRRLDVPDDCKTKATVKPYASEFLAPINAAKKQDVRSTMPVKNFVTSVYFPEHVATLRPASQRQYKTAWRLYIEPRMGNVTLRDFETMDGERILKKIAKETKAARSSLFHCKAFLSGCFAEALRLGVLKNVPNPMKYTTVPKRPATEPTHAYTMPEIRAMLAVLPEPAKTVVLTASYTGLRKSELWALEWRDFDGRTLKVQRSIWNGIASGPKTEASKAAVPITAELQDALEDHRQRMGKLAAGPIFQGDTGKPLNLDNLVRRVVSPALNRCKTCRKPLDAHPTEGHLPERDESLPCWFGWHAFRRGLATNLYSQGVADKVIQGILRHESVETTMDIYVKTVPKSAIEALDALNQGQSFTQSFTKPASRRTGRTQ